MTGSAGEREPGLCAIRDILACPVCRHPLESLICDSCGREYHADEVLDLTPIPPPHREVQAKWGLWEQLQANGQRAYEENPAGNLSVGERADALAFGAFCRLDGRVLDVACGPQELPSYAVGAELVGLDPLRGEQPRRFPFVMGIAEYLPFRDESFDRVLFATSLDHVLSPEMAVSEARRVTKPGGWVCVWHGEVPPNDAPAPFWSRLRVAAGMVRRGQLRELVRRARTIVAPPAFEVPTGAVDPFHFAHPDLDTVLGWLDGAGLSVEQVQSLDGNRFIRAFR